MELLLQDPFMQKLIMSWGPLLLGCIFLWILLMKLMKWHREERKEWRKDTLAMTASFAELQKETNATIERISEQLRQALLELTVAFEHFSVRKRATDLDEYDLVEVHENKYAPKSVINL